MKKIFIAPFIALSLVIKSFCSIEAAAIENIHAPYNVGELGEAWQFPSDHLPIGLTLGSIHIAFWNNLNKDYLVHIEANTQGLRNSSILKDHISLDSDHKLTLRELKIGNLVLEMINHPTHPRSLIALQETHPDLQDFLTQHVPSHWKVITPLNQPYSQDLFLYDTAVFECLSIDSILYNENEPKSILTLTLEEIATGKVYRFVQSHVPGGPIKSKPGCAKFSQEALRQFDPRLTIVLMGDMNQSSQVIDEALKLAASSHHFLDSPYQYLSIPYPSHMNTHQQASWIDHFFVYSPDNKLNIHGSHNPEELSQELVPLVQLLQRLSIQEKIKLN